MESVRFLNAITKLYEAFHNNLRHPECACQCAVGNICDNNDTWKYFSDNHGSTTLNYVGIINEKLGKKLQGYLPSELLRIEQAFLRGCGYQLPFKYNNFKPSNPKNKELQYEGLCAVITILCKLEGIKDLTNYSKLFETEEEQPKYKLETII